MSVPELSTAFRAGPSAWMRLRTHVRRAQLDRLLADGRNPATDPRLALRAAQLASPAARARLAATILDVVHCVDETALAMRMRPQALVEVASVRQCADELSGLAGALTCEHPRLRGVAIASTLLNDGLGPLYLAGQADRLRNTVLGARSAL